MNCEATRPRGRPSLHGAQVSVTLPADQLQRIEHFAAGEAIHSRAEAVRRLLTRGLDAALGP